MKYTATYCYLSNDKKEMTDGKSSNDPFDSEVWQHKSAFRKFQIFFDNTLHVLCVWQLS